MGRPRKRGAVIASIAAAAVLAAGCGSSSSNDDGTLIIGAEQEPDCMDWMGTCSGSSWAYWMVGVNTMPRAFDVKKQPDGTYRYEPSIVLAGEPQVETEPKLKVTYTINEDAVWSDGTPITSEDFKYTWEQVFNNQDDIYDPTGFKNIESVDASDPKVAVVTFAEPFQDWKGLFGGNYGIYPSKYLEGKDRGQAMRDGYTISGGPWLMESWKKTDSITLVPNERYWGAKPTIDKVIFKVQPDTSAQFTAFKSNQVAAIYPQPQVDAIEQINAGIANTAKDIQSTTGNFEALWLNNGAPPFDDVAVRRAVAYALDRETIVARLFGGVGLSEPLNFLQAPVIEQYGDPDAFSRYRQDLTKVDELMTAAGYAKDASGAWTKDGQKVSFTIHTTAGNKRRELTQQIAQQQLVEAGFDVRLEGVKAGDLFGDLLPHGRFQAGIYAQVLTTLGASTCNLFCSENSSPIGETGGYNYTRTRIPALDDKLRAMDVSTDDAETQRLGREASQIMADEAISIPLDPLPNLLLWNTTVIEGPVADNGILGPFWNLHEWTLK